MAAVFLAPLYLLCNAYIVYWMIRWLRAAVPALGAGAGLAVVLAVYFFLMLSLLTSFLIQSYPAKRYMKKISDQWLGSFAYILGITFLLDLIHRLFPGAGWRWQERRLPSGWLASSFMEFTMQNRFL